MNKWILIIGVLLVFLPVTCNPTPTTTPTIPMATSTATAVTSWPTKVPIITLPPPLSISPVPTVGAELLPSSYPDEDDFIPGRLLVKPKPGYRIEDDDQIGDLGIYVVDFAVADGVNPYVATLAKMSGMVQSGRFEWVETDSIVHIMDDPYLGNQYHLQTTSTIRAWTYTKGYGIKVAIIDTGFDRSQPDLMGQVIAEKDYVNNDNYADDDHGHGTHVSGIVFAKEGNGIGGAGVCPLCQGMVCKALSANGSGSVSNVSRCIAWASGTGADVINMSLGSPRASNTLLEAVRQANKNGTVVVSAAGNSGSSYPQYPAAYSIAVGAVDRNDRRASFSNYGGYVDVSAPGVSVVSTLIGGGYGPMSGTSMASPVAAGVVALIRSVYPDMSVAEVEEQLENTADDVDQGLGGRVNALRAVSQGEVPTPTPGGVVATPTTTLPTATPAADVEGRLHQLINDYRVEQGLSSLNVIAQLVEAARVQSRDMAANSFCGHYGSDGSNPFDRMRNAGYPLLTGGEIVACGYVGANEAFRGWLDSPGHHAIIVGDYDDFGCGYAEGGKWHTSYTCDFAQPRGGLYHTPTPAPIATVTPTPAIPVYNYCLGCLDEMGQDQCQTIECP